MNAARRTWNYLFDEDKFQIGEFPLLVKALVYAWIYFWAIGVPVMILLTILDLIFGWRWFKSGGHCSGITGDCTPPD
jgi:hypothetical protein